MFNNNIDAINAAFYIINKKEDKINYYYEPRFSKKEKDWKRSYIFKELEDDFLKDINNFGFSPYIDCTFNEQKKNKNIEKYNRIRNYDFSNYIKKMNSLIHSKPKINNLLIKSSDKTKNIKLNKTPTNNLFLEKIKKTREIFKLNYHFKHNLSTKNKKPKIIKASKLTQIVKFNRDENQDLSKINLIINKENNEMESSFNYDDKKKDKSGIDYNFENINNKKDNNINKTFSINHNSKQNLRIKSFSNQFFNNKENSHSKIRIRKIKFKGGQYNSILYNNNRLNNNEDSFYKNKSFSLFKNNYNERLMNLKKGKFNNKHRNAYLELLENYSGGIFKSAKKYQYQSKN